MLYQSLLSSPLGDILITSNGDSINAISFRSPSDSLPACDLTELAKKQLNEYLEGKRIEFDFPIEQDGTSFQKSVWNELLKIAPGAPISYAAFSKRMNNPLAIRAIASANGKNKIAIVVPCHRVIGSRGELVGYAGELWRKKWLLEHEARMTNTGQSSLIF